MTVGARATGGTRIGSSATEKRWPVNDDAKPIVVGTIITSWRAVK